MEMFECMLVMGNWRQSASSAGTLHLRNDDGHDDGLEWRSSTLTVNSRNQPTSYMDESDLINNSSLRRCNGFAKGRIGIPGATGSCCSRSGGESSIYAVRNQRVDSSTRAECIDQEKWFAGLGSGQCEVFVDRSF